MDRRNFLKGTFGGLAAGGIIISATDADVALFASKAKPQDPVDLSLQLETHAWARLGELLYNERHQPVGIIREIQSNQSPVDITGAGEQYRTVMPGLRNVIYTVGASGFVPPVPHQHTR